MTSGYFSSSYREDMIIFRTGWIRVWMLLFLVFLLFIPLMLPSHNLYLLNMCGITIISAMGLNLLTGYTGQISMAQSAFMGIGAYTSVLLGLKGIPFWITFPTAGLVAGLFGFVLGFPSLRLKGMYLIMSTMAFEVIIEYVIMQWESLTKGPTGLDAPHPKLGSLIFDSDVSYYYMILTLLILALLFMKNLVRSKVGRAFVAIRDHDVAAKMIGISLTKYKLMAFVISSVFAGIAGALYGYYIHHFDPEQFNMMISIEYLAIVIIGGMGTIVGTIFGALFMMLTPEILRIVMEGIGLGTFISSVFFQVKAGFFGLMIIVFLLWEPGGLFALWGKVKQFFRIWPYHY